MAPVSSPWWTDARVDATVTREYVLKHVEPRYHSQLHGPIAFGEGLTDDSYIDWVLQRARRFFLILVDIGVPIRIFSLVDETYDDTDLPIDSNKAEQLRLSQNREDVFLNWRFIQAQARYMARDIEVGEHITYGNGEAVPVESAHQRSHISLSANFPTDKVVLSGAVCKEYLQLRIKVGDSMYFHNESDVLQEIKSYRQFSHEHIMGIYASYYTNNTVNLLFSQLPEYSLKSLLNDKTAQLKKKLSKAEQRLQLVNWPNCLANGLAWLHEQGQGHGAIRPSNILIDSRNRIFLGLSDAFDTLVGPKREDVIETYHYAAPEQWAGRSTPDRSITSSFTPLNRTGSRTITKKPSIQPDMAPPRTPKSVPDESNFAKIYQQPMPFASVNPTRKFSETPSPTKMGSFSTSSGSSNTIMQQALNQSNSNLNGHDSNQTPFASDIFSLAAVTLDIITYVCKRRQSSFIQHRSSSSNSNGRNRSSIRSNSISDASFHADRNTSRLFTWIDILNTDASRLSDPSFHAVEPMLATVKQMIARVPESRPSSSQVAEKFAMSIHQIDFGSTQPHCRVKQTGNLELDGVDNRTFSVSKTSFEFPYDPSNELNDFNSPLLDDPSFTTHSNNSSLSSAQPDEPITPQTPYHPKGLPSISTTLDPFRQWPTTEEKQRKAEKRYTNELIDGMLEDFHFPEDGKRSLPAPTEQNWHDLTQNPITTPKPITTHAAQNYQHHHQFSNATDKTIILPPLSPKQVSNIADGCNRSNSNSSSDSSNSAIDIKKKAFTNFSRHRSLASPPSH